jgi:hypothetical protein
MGNKVIWHSHDQAFEDVNCLIVAFGFQVGFANQTIGFQVFGEGVQDMTAVRNRFIQLTTVHQVFNLLIVYAQRYFRHGRFSLQLASQSCTVKNKPFFVSMPDS